MQSNKGFAPLAIILVIFLIAIAGIVYFFMGNRGSEVIESQEENTTTTIPQLLEIPDPYVLVSDVQENSAVFSFQIPIQGGDIIPQNIRYCVLNMNAVPPTKQSCDEQTSTENGFTLFYNQSVRTLTITGNSNGNQSTGVFKTGCAACTSNIEFRNLYTEDGQLLPTRRVEVY